MDLDHQDHGQSTKPIEIVKAVFGVVQVEEFITRIRTSSGTEARFGVRHLWPRIASNAVQAIRGHRCLTPQGESRILVPKRYRLPSRAKIFVWNQEKFNASYRGNQHRTAQVSNSGASSLHDVWITSIHFFFSTISARMIPTTTSPVFPSTHIGAWKQSPTCSRVW